MVPPWLRPGVQVGPPCPCGRRGRRRNFLEATLDATRGFLADMLGGERGGGEWAGGWLGQVGGRAKLAGALALLVATGLAHRPLTLAALHLLAAATAVSAGLPLGRYLRRVWIGVPLLTAAMMVPATLSWVTGGEPALWLWRGGNLALTEQGLLAALRAVLRTGTSVGYVLLVTWTTPWRDIYRALGALGVPRVFVALLMMTHRYMVVLVQLAEDLFLARRARPGPVSGRAGARGGRDLVAGAAGVLLHRAHVLAGEVEEAMRARGFRGELRLLSGPRPGRIDWLLPAGTAFIALVTVLGDRLSGG